MNVATAAGERLKLTGSISQKTGLAPARAIVPAVAKKVNGLVMTSSPGPISRAISARSSSISPGGDTDAVFALAIGGDARLQLFDRRAKDEALACADLLDDRLDLGCQRAVLRLEVKQRDLHDGWAWAGLDWEGVAGIQVSYLGNAVDSTKDGRSTRPPARHALIR